MRKLKLAKKLLGFKQSQAYVSKRLNLMAIQVQKNNMLEPYVNNFMSPNIKFKEYTDSGITFTEKDENDISVSYGNFIVRDDITALKLDRHCVNRTDFNKNKDFKINVMTKNEFNELWRS